MASTEKPLEPLASHGPQEFKALVLEQLGMVVARQAPGLTIYRNERGGFLRAYGRRGLYEFGIADYTIDHPFAIAFDSPNHLLRFGAMYDGETRFQMQGTEADAFRPSVFVTHEHDLRGVQRW